MNEKHPSLKIDATEDGVRVVVAGNFIEILGLYILAGINLFPQNVDKKEVLRKKFLELVSNRKVWEMAFAGDNSTSKTFVNLSQIKDMKRSMENDEKEQMD